MYHFAFLLLACLCTAAQSPPTPSLQTEAIKFVAAARTVAVDNAVTFLTANNGAHHPYNTLCLKTLHDVGVRNAVMLNFGAAFTHDLVTVVNVLYLPPCNQPDERRRISCARLFYLFELLKAGIDVFQVDTDIIFFKDPYPYFIPNVDVQAMSDGVILDHAYGYNSFTPTTIGDAKIDRAAKTPGQVEFRVNQLNIGCVFIRSNERTILLLNTTTQTLQHTNVWEQLLLSQLILSWTLQNFLSFLILDPYFFMNSGFYINNDLLFPPVLVHSSHHVDKHGILVKIQAHNFSKPTPTELPDAPFVFDFNGSPYSSKV